MMDGGEWNDYRAPLPQNPPLCLWGFLNDKKNASEDRFENNITPC